MAYNNSDEIYITIHKDDPEAFYAKIPYDKLPNVHRIGGKWMQSGKEWRFPLDDEIWAKFQKEFASEFAAGKVHKDVAFLLAFDKRHQSLDKFLQFKETAMKDEPTDFGVEGVGINGQNCLFNYQRWGVQCGLSVGDGFLIGDSMGLGKAEVVDNKLFTPNGRKRMGDISTGDKVIGSDGYAHNVIGVYPQGMRNVYRITFSDGCSLECDENHLWNVRHGNCSEPYQTLSTLHLYDKEGILSGSIASDSKEESDKVAYYKCGNGNGRWQIPIVKPIHFENGDALPIDPYLFGLILGCGNVQEKCASVKAGKNDFEELFSDYISRHYFNAHELKSSTDATRRIDFSFDGELVSIGIANKHAWDRFIPDCYKYSSVENRLALLCGMMDANGNVIANSRKRANSGNDAGNDAGNGAGIEYSTVSEHLAMDVMELVQTLGGLARLHAGKVKYSKNGVMHKSRKEYRLNISTPENFNPFHLKRKADAYQATQNRGIVRYIQNIEYIGEKETVCIRVDAADSLYVTEHCIVTHNTIQGIGIAKAHMNKGEARNCLIICPASLKYNWRDEIKKFTGMDALVIGHKCKNASEREKQWIAEGYPFKIVNYETIARDLYADPKKTDNRISCYKAVLNSFDVLVFDEMHMLKHHSSQRTLACRQFNAKYKIGLTGTPLDGRLEEIHSIFQILKPGLFVSKQKFMERYAEYDYFGAVKGYHHIKEVSDKIAPYYLRRLKEEVLKDLPPKLYKDMMVELSPKNMKAYKDLVKKKNEITTDASAMELVMRARQFLDFPEILGMHNTSDKYAMFKELIDELVKENDHKVLVFSQYTNTLHWLMKNLETEYDDILVIDGSVSPEERQEICKKFNSDPKYKILLGSNAMSTGLNLQSANDVINYTSDFSPAIMAQRADRAYRCGVKHTVTIYNFVCMDTVDERVRNILSKKQTVNNALLGENIDSFDIGGLSSMEILSCL